MPRNQATEVLGITEQRRIHMVVGLVHIDSPNFTVSASKPDWMKISDAKKTSSTWTGM
jgi:hypothetical protein